MRPENPRTALFSVLGRAAPAMLGGGAWAAGAAAGAAAVDYFFDDNDECNGPNDEGLLDSDCND